MSAFNHAWLVIKGMNPMDDPRIRAHRSPNPVYRTAAFKAREPFDPNNVIVDQEVTRMGRPAPDLRNPELDVRHRRSYGVPDGPGSMPLLSDELDRIRVPTRDRDKELNKALSTEDLRMAARTGGIQMTPERRQAYADAGLPLSTGGGFRTMPESTARNLINRQRDRNFELSNADQLAAYEPKQGLAGLETYESYFSPRHLKFMPVMDSDAQEELRHILTEGDFTRDINYEDAASPEGAVANENERRERLRNMPEFRRLPVDVRADGKIYPQIQRNEFRDKLIADYGGEIPPPIPPQPGFDRFHAADPPRNPESEFSRRGDAGASPSDQAFKIIQQRKENAERMKQVQADRQREMMMRVQRERMKSKQPPKGRAGGRRPGEGKNAYKNRMRRQGGRR